ncbi:hypothetical protein F0P96_00345 [Hymenobacter busanensis]|uniref:Copper-binding protein MbnP-like domain-containing protein n=1 Tax=Hymenobacter busanensis TaxID=2607656 RepID=A0A7L5A067_9BACT|nr:MbnP family protein [Hymenobacter busanensis]KAA9339118.1 hypothetical protein F0P96_00345 [Hymenobacter busanensis]QHJ07120.1 hypothetical protein GUY19_07405 [Hymenobacter busanensis]
MKFPKLTTLLFSLATASLLFASCDDDEDQPATGSVDLEFENVVGNQALTLNASTYYTTEAGDQFKVSKFNYFISNVKLTKSNGTTWAEPESYHLVKQAEENTHSFTLKDVPTGDYTQLTFTIGVDSTRNVSGAQTGALAQNNDMYWSWSSGYIFLKMEGSSPQAANPGNLPNGGPLQFHIGGFRKPNNTVQTVSPSLPASTALKVRGTVTPQVHLKADLNKMFAGPNTVRFATLAGTGHSSDPNSVKISQNYAAGMFRIDHIHAD